MKPQKNISDNLKSKTCPELCRRIQNLKWLGLSVVTFVLVVVVPVVEAQQPAKIPRIGYLSASSAAALSARVEAFRQGLRELGYVEGRDIVVDWRYAEGKLDRQRELADDLVRLKVDVIVSAGPEPTRAAKAVASAIPIVMTNDPDPVGDGFVARLARPGGNITGLSTFAPELSGKRVEILTEVVPKLSRVVVLGTSTAPGHAQMIRQTELAVKTFRVKHQYLDVLDSKDIEAAFRAASSGQGNGVLTLPSGILILQRSQVVELAAKNRIPAIYSSNQFIEPGGLMFYGVNALDLDRRAATYVDKILKGAKPGDLPVEQPTKFEFVINLKAAKQIGLTIPPNVLARADRVIR
jgi:putative tryptophan/tyrosine transport system substrate-binding protein